METGGSMTLIGSDPDHSAWCLRTAKKCIADAKRQLGSGWAVFTHDARQAFVMARVLNIVAGQVNSWAPLWRMQELIVVASDLFSTEED